MKKKEKKEYVSCDYCTYDIVDNEGELMEHECLITCCGIEITGKIEDVGLCPECLEHI